MAKPTPLSGFPELLPRAAVRRDAGASPTLARTFELHGFANIETRAVEPLDQLLRKGGDLQGGLRPAAGSRPATTTADAGLGLHFDLTVPFARYVLEHAGKLEFPFRRYQIQKAWRGERPQEGRYRRVHPGRHRHRRPGRAALPPRRRGRAGDGRRARRRLPIPPLTPPGQQPQADPGVLPRARAARPRRGDARRRQARQARRADTVAELLVDEAGAHRRAGRALPGAGRRSGGPDTSFVDQVRALGVEDELLEEGLDELAAVVDGLRGRS